jgi:hypothetical protein
VTQLGPHIAGRHTKHCSSTTLLSESPSYAYAYRGMYAYPVQLHRGFRHTVGTYAYAYAYAQTHSLIACADKENTFVPAHTGTW